MPNTLISPVILISGEKQTIFPISPGSGNTGLTLRNAFYQPRCCHSTPCHVAEPVVMSLLIGQPLSNSEETANQHSRFKQLLEACPQWSRKVNNETKLKELDIKS